MTRRRDWLAPALGWLTVILFALSVLLMPPRPRAQPPAPPDDTSRVEAMLASVGPSGTVRIPGGQYVITRPLKWPASGVNVQGDGINSTTLLYRGPAGTHCLTMGNPGYPVAGNWPFLRLSDLTIDGTGGQNAAGGLCLYGCTRFTVERVRCRQFREGAGVTLLSCWIGEIASCQTSDCKYGIKATASPGVQSFNAVTVRGGEHGPGTRIGILVGEEDQAARADPLIGAVLNIVDTCIEGTKLCGVMANDGDCINLDHVYFEACCKQVDPGKPAACVRLGTATSYPRCVDLHACRFASTLGTDPALGACVWATYADSMTCRSCRFDPAARGSCGVKYIRNVPWCPIAENSWSASVNGRRVEGP